MDNWFMPLGENAILAMIAALSLAAALAKLQGKRKSDQTKNHAIRKMQSRKSEHGARADENIDLISSRSELEVWEIDLMEEADIFITYGYYEKAADTLRRYLSNNGEQELLALKKLQFVDIKLREFRAKAGMAI